MPDIMLRDLIELPDHVSKGDFVLRLSEGITHPDATVDSYVVTEQLAKCFNEALSLIQGAVTSGSSKGTYLHGSFGSGKSHFMAVLHLLLQGHTKARAIPEMAGVVTRHDPWLKGKKFLLVPYHMIGSASLESAVLGGYVEYVHRLHPSAPAPAVYNSAQVLANADKLREQMGDAAFFAALGGGRPDAGQGWGEIHAGWDATSYAAAVNAGPRSEAQRRLVGDLVDTLLPAVRNTSEFQSLDDGLSTISHHAKGLGYHAVVLFLDEMILWLASHASDQAFLNREVQKVPKLVEAANADRPVPIVSFIARQRDLRELVGQHVLGAERLSFTDLLKYWEGRFSTISLEDRNLAVIAERRLLKPRDAEAKRRIDEEFKRTVAAREEVIRILLTSKGTPDDFRRLYPFSPAVVETLVAISSLLQRERTALKIMLQLLVEQKDSLRLGELVPLGDLYSALASGDEAFSADMKRHFENAQRLYERQLLPMLEEQHQLTLNQVYALPTTDPKRTAFHNDDRLIKTLLLSALAPEVESLRNLTPQRLAALNHGTIKSPIPGQEGRTVLGKVRSWATVVGQIKIQESAETPTIALQLAGVDVEAIIEKADSEDNHGNRLRLVKRLLFEQFGLKEERDFWQEQRLFWRGTERRYRLVFNNVADLPDDSLQNEDEDDWRVIIDYPFDQGNKGVRDDLTRLSTFREAKGSTRTLVWVPSFLGPACLKELGLLVRLEHILTEERFPTFVSHLAPLEREAARSTLTNQRDALRLKMLRSLEAVYGVASETPELVDAMHRLEPIEHFQSLDIGFTPQVPGAATLGDALSGFISQALDAQYPAHPRFPEEARLTRGAIEKVFQNLQRAIQSPEGRALVDKAERASAKQIIEPLRAGQMGETHCVPGEFWKNHFLQREASLSTPLSVGQLRRWMDEPKAMGLPRLLQDLVILVFAEQANRKFLRHSAAVLPEIGKLDDELVLREETLPDADSWQQAITRAQEIFGITDLSPLRNASNLAVFVDKLTDATSRYEVDASSLVESLKAGLEPHRVNREECDRLRTAEDAVGLLAASKGKKGAALVSIFAAFALRAPSAAIAKSLTTTKTVLAALGRDTLELLSTALSAPEPFRSEAERLFQRLQEAFRQDEYVRSLPETTADVNRDTVDLLKRIMQGPKPPAPPPKPPPPVVTAPPPDTYKGPLRLADDTLPDFIPVPEHPALLVQHQVSREGREDRAMLMVTPSVSAWLLKHADARVSADGATLDVPSARTKVPLQAVEKLQAKN